MLRLLSVVNVLDVFGLLRGWRRRRLAQRPWPTPWDEILRTRVPFTRSLSDTDKDVFRRHLKAFVWEKAWIGAGGQTIDDEVKVVIAAAAVRLIQNLDLTYYDNLTEIVVYPSTYRHPSQGGAAIFGEAHRFGTVVLAWDAVTHGLSTTTDGHDTATHEFAHVLDVRDGTFDGTPQLHAREDYLTWARVMTKGFHKLRARDRRQRKVLRNYGATNEAEFFAVATESFFEKPRQMKKHTPDLYAELVRFYGQDPA